MMIQEMIDGPNTEAVQAIIGRIPTLTEGEVNRLEAAWDAGGSAAWEASWSAACEPGCTAAWEAAWSAARSAATGASWFAARGATWFATIDALLATVTYDIATEEGPYTIAQRDLLLAPWVSVCG